LVLPLPLDGGAERVAGVDGHDLFVEVEGERDQESDDERSEEESGEVVRHQVVPLRAVHARRVREEAQAVVGEDVEPLQGGS